MESTSATASYAAEIGLFGAIGQGLGMDAVLGIEELLEVLREDGCEFLPCEEFEPSGEGWAVDRGEDREAGFDEVAAAAVTEDAEGGFGGEGGKGVAEELVTLHGAEWGPWQASDVEDSFEIAVAFDEAWGGGLEVGFGEFGFDE